MLRPDGVKDKKYCGFHDRNSHSINECRVFRVRIQKAIQEGHRKFDNKMKLDGNPFPHNMIGFSINMVNVVEGKEKVKVLTSEKTKQDGSIDPTRQVTIEQIHKKEPRLPKSQIEVGESSKPRVTSCILLNKWQRQQEKERYQKHKYEEEKRRYEEEMYRKEHEEYMREQERAHWGCAFFRHCWNEGLKLPTQNNCPECSDRYTEYKKDIANRRSVHEKIGRVHPSGDQRLKIKIDDQPRKRYADHRWVDHEEEEDHGYVCQKGQWCPPGLRRSQKRRVQRLRNQELKQAGIKKRQVWRAKDKPDEYGRSAHTCMVCFLPNEFMAPANQIVQEEILPDMDEAEQLGLMAQLMLTKQATFDKPAKNRHMRPLYLRGYVNGKPLTKMFVDGGAAVNVMPYTTFRKLGMGPGVGAEYGPDTN
jgi:hypothetical protein